MTNTKTTAAQKTVLNMLRDGQPVGIKYVNTLRALEMKGLVKSVPVPGTNRLAYSMVICTFTSAAGAIGRICSCTNCITAGSSSGVPARYGLARSSAAASEAAS